MSDESFVIRKRLEKAYLKEINGSVAYDAEPRHAKRFHDRIMAETVVEQMGTEDHKIIVLRRKPQKQKRGFGAWLKGLFA